jgi:hypothetical protein
VTGKIVEENNHGKPEVIFQHLPGRTEDKEEKPFRRIGALADNRTKYPLSTKEMLFPFRKPNWFTVTQ